MLLLLALMIAALPPLILLEYLFEATNSDSFTLCGFNIHAPIYYLELLEVRTKVLYASLGKRSAKFLNFMHSLNITNHILLFWQCTKSVTNKLFKSVAPINDFRKEFNENIHSTISQAQPISGIKRARPEMSNLNEMKNSHEKFLKDYLGVGQSTPKEDIDEKSKEDIEEFTNREVSSNNLDSATNVFGMDKIYRLGDKVDPTVNPSDEHNSIMRNNLNDESDRPIIIVKRISWGDPHDDIKYST